MVGDCLFAIRHTLKPQFQPANGVSEAMRVRKFKFRWSPEESTLPYQADHAFGTTKSFHQTRN
jgi:hypothetical protein